MKIWDNIVLLTPHIMTTALSYCTYFAFSCMIAYLEFKWYSTVKMLILTCLFCFDIVTGIYKSYALWTVWEKEYYDNGKVKNTWFNTTVLKVGILWKIMLLLIPVAFIWLTHLIGIELIRMIAPFIALIWAAEFISIVQNFIVARTKRSIQEFDAISFVLWWVLDVVKKWITKTLTTQPYKKDGV